MTESHTSTSRPPKSNLHQDLKIREAKTFFGRLRGLIGRELAHNEGLFFRKANSLHTCFMGYSLDIFFLDDQFKVIKIVRHLRPWRFSIDRHARHFLEIPSKQSYNISIGDTLSIEPQQEAIL